MAANYEVTQVVAKEALMELKNSLQLAKNVGRQYSGEFEKTDIGKTIEIKRPVRYSTNNTLQINNFQNPYERVEPLTLSPLNVGVQVSAEDLRFNINNFNETVIRPAIISLANSIDATIGAEIQSFNLFTGTPGTPINSFQTIIDFNQLLLEYGISQSDVCLILDPTNYGGALGSLYNLFNRSVSDPIVRKGYLGTLLDMYTYQDQNIVKHTVGNYSGTPVTAVAGETGANLTTSGWTANVTGLLKKYDKITIDGVFGVNPLTRSPTSRLAQFTVTDDVDSDASGNAVIPIYPSINDGTLVDQEPYKNVSISIPLNAAVNVLGAANSQYVMNAGFWKEGVTLATATLKRPFGAPYFYTAVDEDTKIGISVTADFDINNAESKMRFDVYVGAKAFSGYGAILAG
ncbi:MAG: hypothetical protein D6746_08115 [Bacteroidetes bacterium]|nr:MAG: hypothetical protein D6746_08115 [Bacteroidota bacterium]